MSAVTMFYATEFDEFSLEDFRTRYAFPTLAMVKGGFHGDSHQSILDTGQVLRVQGTLEERRVLCTVLSDPAKCFGYNSFDVTLSLPESCDIQLFILKKGKPGKKTSLLQTVIAESKLPVDVQFNITPEINCKLRVGDRRIPMKGDIKLRLVEKQNVKYLYGNPVNEGQLHRNIFCIPTHSVDAMLSLVTGLVDGDDEYYQSIVEAMDYTVNTYIDFGGRIGCRDVIIVPKSLQDKIHNSDTFPKHHVDAQQGRGKCDQVYDETIRVKNDDHVYDVIADRNKRTGGKRSESDIQESHKTKEENILPSSKMASDRLEKIVPEFIRRRNNFSPRRLKESTDSGVYEQVPLDSPRELSQLTVQRRRLPSVPDESSEFPAIEEETKRESAGPHKTFINVSDSAVVTPITILRSVSTASDVSALSVQDLGQYLQVLKLDKYVKKFAESLVDGVLLQDLDEKVLREEFNLTRFEAIKLCKFARTGYLPNVSEFSCM